MKPNAKTAKKLRAPSNMCPLLALRWLHSGQLLILFKHSTKKSSTFDDSKLLQFSGKNLAATLQCASQEPPSAAGGGASRPLHVRAQIHRQVCNSHHTLCVVLYFTLLFCTVYCTLLWCTVLCYAELSTLLYCTVMHCTLYCTLR